jgi:hypothetical protein
MKLLTPFQAHRCWVWCGLAAFAVLAGWIAVAKVAGLGPQPGLFWVLMVIPASGALFGFLGWWHGHELKSLFQDDLGKYMTPRQYQHRAVGLLRGVLPGAAVALGFCLIGYVLSWVARVAVWIVHMLLRLPYWTQASMVLAVVAVAWLCLGTRKLAFGGLLAVVAVVCGLGPPAALIWLVVHFTH